MNKEIQFEMNGLFDSHFGKITKVTIIILTLSSIYRTLNIAIYYYNVYILGSITPTNSIFLWYNKMGDSKSHKVLCRS